jgi:hypothetical protein
VDIRRVVRTPQLAADIFNKEQEFNKNLLQFEAEDWPWPESDFYELKAEAFDEFTTGLNNIEVSPNPLQHLTPFFTDSDGNDYRYYSTEKWWAYYFLYPPKEAAVAFLMSEAELKENEFLATLEARLKDYR